MCKWFCDEPNLFHNYLYRYKWHKYIFTFDYNECISNISMCCAEIQLQLLKLNYNIVRLIRKKDSEKNIFSRTTVSLHKLEWFLAGETTVFWVFWIETIEENMFALFSVLCQSRRCSNSEWYLLFFWHSFQILFVKICLFICYFSLRISMEGVDDDEERNKQPQPHLFGSICLRNQQHWMSLECVFSTLQMLSME